MRDNHSHYRSLNIIVTNPCAERTQASARQMEVSTDDYVAALLRTGEFGQSAMARPEVPMSEMQLLLPSYLITGNAIAGLPAHTATSVAHVLEEAPDLTAGGPAKESTRSDWKTSIRLMLAVIEREMSLRAAYDGAKTA
ncbi:hypothetical protein EOD42_05825 [Rhodovarius crocodyli]|uniref:Uncharacterized protein n=1 Tax=Rhodovarius crocodyli TaxID=1979269 RepID=A0A437MPN1_9PROT|nr:hypothetical protein [Rhodovarius crocodyli]RVT99596.1 hypothetical protein EOD42_05825 [Rhodovarius crocodyli]